MYESTTDGRQSYVMWLHSESRRYMLMDQSEYSYSQNTGQFYA